MAIKVIAIVAFILYLISRKLLKDDPSITVHRAWPRNVNRDMKAYILPDKKTTIHEPKDVCVYSKTKNNKLFILIVTTSSINNFKNRVTIRDTWGSYKNYTNFYNIIHDYQIKKGDFGKVVASQENDTLQNFKVVFLLGLPNDDNFQMTQEKIDEEASTYGDILQESFVDSYQNLSIKSVMMLKWVTKKCKDDDVRYIVKTDDDVYINLPYLMQFLRKISKSFEEKVQEGYTRKPYELIGNLICAAKPSADLESKWYSPRYMFNKKRYPCFTVGWAYALSYAAVAALYEAAMETPVFHLEDVYVTGICREAAAVPITTISVSDELVFDANCRWQSACTVFNKTVCHDIDASVIAFMHMIVLMPGSAQRCDAELKSRASIEKTFSQFEDGDEIISNLNAMF